MVTRLHLAAEPAATESGVAVPLPIRVVLADPHRLMRHGLRLVLDGEIGIEVVGEAADLGEAEALLEAERPDLLVADLQTDGALDGEVLHGLIERIPAGTGLVALTLENVPGYARRALDAGVLGFVSKQFADTDLGPAIRAAARGEVYVSPTIAARRG